MTRDQFMRKLARLRKAKRAKFYLEDTAIRVKLADDRSCDCPLSFVGYVSGFETTPCTYITPGKKLGLPFRTIMRIVDAADGHTRGPIRTALFKACGLAEAA